jgi:hypothetical protein
VGYNWTLITVNGIVLKNGFYPLTSQVPSVSMNNEQETFLVNVSIALDRTIT